MGDAVTGQKTIPALTPHRPIVGQLSLRHNLQVPLAEVDALRGDAVLGNLTCIDLAGENAQAAETWWRGWCAGLCQVFPAIDALY